MHGSPSTSDLWAEYEASDAGKRDRAEAEEERKLNEERTKIIGEYLKDCKTEKELIDKIRELKAQLEKIYKNSAAPPQITEQTTQSEIRQIESSLVELSRLQHNIKHLADVLKNLERRELKDIHKELKADTKFYHIIEEHGKRNMM